MAPSEALEAQLAPVVSWVGEQVSAESRVFAVGGPGGAGKSTVAKALQALVDDSVLLTLDDFRLPREARPPDARFGSHPGANDLAAIEAALTAFRKGEAVSQPHYDSALGCATEFGVLPPASILIVEGELAAHTALRPLWDGLILVTAHWRTLLNTRLRRDRVESGFSLEKALEVYLQSNLRDYPRFAGGAEEAADWIVRRSSQGNWSARKSS